MGTQLVGILHFCIVRATVEVAGGGWERRAGGCASQKRKGPKTGERVENVKKIWGLKEEEEEEEETREKTEAKDGRVEKWENGTGESQNSFST